jgi:hypothetical protein
MDQRTPASNFLYLARSLIRAVPPYLLDLTQITTNIPRTIRVYEKL